MSPISIAAYLALFTGVGFAFVLVNLLVGRLLRPRAPNAEKLEIYECGEPAIGSSFVQFDLRFYVVALLFIIFDVEVAFFFPWATVFGKASQLRELGDPVRAAAVVALRDGEATGSETERAQAEATGYGQLVAEEFAELGVPAATLPLVMARVPADAGIRIGPLAAEVGAIGRRLAWVSAIDILVFFAVLLVGFFYVWKRGDLDWVRAVSRQRAAQPVPPGEAGKHEPVLV